MIDIDVEGQLNAAERRVGTRALAPGEAHVVTLGRVYDTDIDDLWDACTNAERIPRWFLPVSGDLRAGGHYQLEGNAGGTIETCDPPKGFSATWEYGGSVSWIAVRLTSEANNRTRFELEHVSLIGDETWAQFGPGAVGIGWDLALTGLERHLATGEQLDPQEFEAWSASDDGRRFVTACSDAWCEANIAAGADEATAWEVAARTTAAYTGAH